LNVLISDISGFKAVVICKFLKKNYGKLNIVGFDTRDFTKRYRTKYCDKNYVINRKNYIKLVSNIIDENHVDVFIPTHSSEMEVVLKNRHKLGSALDYFGPYETFRRLNEKDQLHKLAVELGIHVPKIYEKIENAKVNCVVKPIDSSSAKGVEYFFDQKKLAEAKPRLQSRRGVIVQEYIHGKGIGYSVFAEDGQIIAGFGHKRLAEYPTTGGSSVYRETYENEEIRVVAEKILVATKWSGFAMFEYKLTPDNHIYLIEVNPRIWGSINQGLQNGVNYFENILGKADLGAKNESRKIKTYVSPLIYLALLKYLMRLNFKPPLAFIFNLLSNKADINMYADFRGWFGTICRKLA